MLHEQQKVFVSYRRTDSAAAARWVARSIATTFGAQSVFIDVDSIRSGDQWRQRIDDELSSSTALIPIIGERWLSCQGQDFRRRIDEEDDWVRKEIEYALEHRLAILPVLLSPTAMPSSNALPTSLSRLPDNQGMELRNESWDRDLHALIDRLVELGFQKIAPHGSEYPSPMIQLREYTAVELAQVLCGLPGWRYVESEMPEAPGKRRAELYRRYRFASFEDAIEFMHSAATGISQRQHHPRWENIWRTVSVWLSTWDIGHKPSALDAELAAHLDSIRKRYPPW